MSANKLFLSVTLALLVVAGNPGRSNAADNPTTCTNDIDCVATPACGGDVCDWGTSPPKCKAAGSQPKGDDGWCAVDADCKCKGLGAKCSAPYCTFTKPSDAPATGGAGTTGAAGTGSGAGGTTGAAGTGTTGAAGTSTSGGSSGGCAVASSSTGGLGLLVGLALVAGRVVRRRRRGA